MLGLRTQRCISKDEAAHFRAPSLQPFENANVAHRAVAVRLQRLLIAWPILDNVPNWPDHVTGDEMVAAMDKVGVDGAITLRETLKRSGRADTSASCCDRVVAKLTPYLRAARPPPATSPSCGQQPLRRPGGPSRSSRQRAAEGFLRRARFFGTHAPRDKERERTSRKIGRESTT